jgi:lipopolysaccharide export system protein LptC
MGMAVELHLPDLPEVPLALGLAAAPAAPRPVLPWHLRLLGLLSAYLPLVMMLLLALGTWWLVKNTALPSAARPDKALRPDPDYTMSTFTVERFAADGRLKVRLEGDQLRHYPDTDRIEIDGVRVRAIAPDGRITLAHAERALSNGDGSEVQLIGGAQVTSQDAGGQTMVVRSEFLHAFLVTERLSTHLPVWVQRGSTQLRAGGLEYDHGQQRLDLKGPMRGDFPPAGARAVLPAGARAP